MASRGLITSLNADRLMAGLLLELTSVLRNRIVQAGLYRPCSSASCRPALIPLAPWCRQAGLRRPMQLPRAANEHSTPLRFFLSRSLDGGLGPDHQTLNRRGVNLRVAVTRDFSPRGELLKLLLLERQHSRAKKSGPDKFPGI